MTSFTVETACPACGQGEQITVDADGYTRWVDGELIQTALPNLTNTQRERLISGYCKPCWSHLWAEEEEAVEGVGVVAT